MLDLNSEDIEREQRITEARKAMEAAFARGDLEEASRQCQIFNRELKQRSEAANRMLRVFMLGGVD